MRKYFVILFCSLMYLPALSGTFKANVEIDYYKPSKDTIRKELFGGFFEYIFSVMNGWRGVAAQELINRGFDARDCWGVGLSCNWPPYLSEFLSAPLYTLIEGGVNSNGKYFQRITKTGSVGSVGIHQGVHVTDETSYEFYIYMRGEAKAGPVKMSLRDSSYKTIYFEASLGLPSADWRKITIKVPPIKGIHNATLVLSFEGMATVDFDEASFMPDNSVFGLKKEIYDLYKAWGPGCMRFPGGWFADSKAFQWESGIGPLDERGSPIDDFDNTTQRMEFGIDEFLRFCEDVGAEPLYCVNFQNGTPEKAAALVEYCNGPADSKYGAMRAKNGHTNPYGIKYWEIGNEQWFDAVGMSAGYVNFHRSMKAVDPSIWTIIDGCLWYGYNFFDTVMTTVKDECDIYGWHYAEGFQYSKINDDELVFKMLMAGPATMDGNIDQVKSWIDARPYLSNTKQAVTELYTGMNNWYDDPRLEALETGIWTALQLNSFMRHPDMMMIVNRTSHSGMFGYHQHPVTGKRIITPTPTYYAMKMYRQHHGKHLLPAKITCPTYDLADSKEYPVIKNIKWIDATVTASADSIFIAIINRHPTDSVEISFNFMIEMLLRKGRSYVMTSASYLDRNTALEPMKIVPCESDINVRNKITVPPHTLVILAVPNTIKPGSVNEDTAGQAIEIFPNPFCDRLHLKGDGGYLKACLTDIFGTEVLGMEFAGTTDIDTSGIIPGIYIIKLTDGKNTIYRRLIKTGK